MNMDNTRRGFFGSLFGSLFGTTAIVTGVGVKRKAGLPLSTMDRVMDAIHNDEPLLDMAAWVRCGQMWEHGPYRDDATPVYAGISIGKGLSSIVTIARFGDRYEILSHRTLTMPLPGENAREQNKLFHRRFDSTAVMDILMGQKAVWFKNLNQIAIDPWESRSLITLRDWYENGFTPVLVPHTAATLNSAIKELRAAVVERRLRHYDEPVMALMVGSARCRTDGQGKLMIGKMDAYANITGVIAMVTAITLAMSDCPSTSSLAFSGPSPEAASATA